MFTQKFKLENSFDNKQINYFYKNLPSPINNRNTIFTLYGRNAIYLACKLIKLSTDKRVILVPSYTCGDEIKPISITGFKIEVYKVDPRSLQANLLDLKSKIKNEVAGLLITHYFGFPQKKIEEIKILCGDRQICLIEDCAHALGGEYQGKPLGSYGDLSIFSLRKFYPVPHGGALLINNSHYKFKNSLLKTPPFEAVNKDLCVFLSHKTGLTKPGSIEHLSKNDLHGPRLSEFGGYKLGLSNLAKYLLIENASLKKNVRRRNFMQYVNFFRNNKSKSVPLFDNLDQGVVPLFFPLLVDNSEKLFEKISTDGSYFCQPFWSHLHNLTNWNSYPEIANLKQNIIILPVDSKIKHRYLLRLLQQ
jgi:dTDP-4-amino-4,6-dideoxygalactose transaminase